MLEKLVKKQKELEDELFKLNEAVDKAEAKLDVVEELIEEEKARITNAVKEVVSEIEPDPIVASEPVDKKENTILIRYSNEN